MTDLRRDIIRRIRLTGPLSLADFMTDCLGHPTLGYYTTRDPLGADGDFTTAPEISQMFGELVGLALAQAWMDQGSPGAFHLVELGPGRGTLMADVLRATANVPGFQGAMRLSLVEISETLKARQAETLSAYDPRWINGLADLDGAPLFLIANEFFDALPIRQFQRADAGWSERVIGLEGDRLAMGLTPPAALAELAHRLDDTKPGDIVEISPQAIQITQSIAGHIAAHRGAALIFDYGDWRSLGDTVQALRDHAPEDPLANPGDADLTAHVDFEAIASAAKNAGGAMSKLTPQGVVLERLGITARAQSLAKNLSGSALESHIAAHRRLTHPAEMGTLFKAMAVFHPEADPPPGFET
jgi:SAM-dependent MidA family methyltransferase